MSANTFRYSRFIVIAAPFAEIVPEIADLRRHERWSPFAQPDPKSVASYAGEAGEGQTYTFAGGRSGEGFIRIDAVRPDRVLMTLDMKKPMRATNTVEFRLTHEAGGTRVEWALHGRQTLTGRLFGLFVDCDRMCGQQFEQGLAALKTRVERPSQLPLAA